MNTLLSRPSAFASLVQKFFVERLIQQQNASPRTIAAYRDTFRLLLAYIEHALGKSLAATIQSLLAMAKLNGLDPAV